MILSVKYRFLFICNQRTANKSMTSQLMPYVEIDDMINQHHFYNHQTASAIKNIVKADLWDSLFRFAIVRNPFMRILRMWHKHPKVTGEHLSFEQFVCGDYRWKQIPNQWERISENNIALCRWWKFENGVDKAFREITTKIHEQNPTFPVMSLTAKKEFEPALDMQNYRDFYTPRMRQIVEQKHQEDLEKFHYEW